MLHGSFSLNNSCRRILNNVPRDKTCIVEDLLCVLISDTEKKKREREKDSKKGISTIGELTIWLEENEVQRNKSSSALSKAWGGWRRQKFKWHRCHSWGIYSLAGNLGSGNSETWKREH